MGFLTLMASIDNNDLDGKIDFFYKITNDDGNEYLDYNEIYSTCYDILINIGNNDRDMDTKFIDNLSI